MASITEQKADLKSDLLGLVLRAYAEASKSEQVEIVAGLVSRLAQKMTLSELQAWHQRVSSARRAGERLEG